MLFLHLFGGTRKQKPGSIGRPPDYGNRFDVRDRPASDIVLGWVNLGECM